MNVNILETLENLKIFEYYFQYRNYFLYVVLVLEIILFISFKFKFKDNSLWKLIDKDIFAKDLITVISILIIGIIASVFGIKLKIELNQIPIVFFYSSIFILVIQIIECIRYKNTYREVVRRSSNIYIKIIEFTILLLIFANRLESIELIVAVISILILRTFGIIFAYKKTLVDEDFNILKEDYPIKKESELFESRKKQLNSICAELKQFCGERETFAIAISGKWGSGKTSFVNALEEKIENAEFIHIECAIGYDAKAILNEMSLQLMDIFRRNGVYVSQNGIVEEYFYKVATFASDMGYSKFAKVTDSFRVNREKSYLELKNLMNNWLEKFYNVTGKNVYFIVDDMDRVIDNNMRILLFQVVRECVELKYCITLFMIDYDQLIGTNMSKEFLEKYVNYQYELCELKHEEIVNQYLKIYLTSDFFCDKTKYLRSKELFIRNYILEYENNIITELKMQIKKIKHQYVGKKEKQKFEWLLELEKQLYDDIYNPRKVKRYLKEIEKNLFIVDLLWFGDEKYQSNEYSKEPWEKYIVEICFFKIFLRKSYTEMIKAKNFYLLKQDEKNSFIVNFMIKDVHLESEKYNELIETIVYKLYLIDSDIDKSKHQQLLEEIDNNKMRKENILLYLEECMGVRMDFDRVNNIADFCVDNKAIGNDYQSEIIVKMIKLLNFSEVNLRNPQLLKLVKKIKNLIDDKVIEEDKQQIKMYLDEAEVKFIAYNLYSVIDLLKIIYSNVNMNKIEVKNITRISYLFSMIKDINEKEPKIKICETGNDVDDITNYFKSLGKEFSKNEFLEIKENALYFLKPIYNMFCIFEILYREKEEYYKIGSLKINIRNIDYIIQEVKKICKNELNCREIFVEEFIDLSYKIKNNFHIYTLEEKQRLLAMLNETYKEIGKNMNPRELDNTQWRQLNIDLFMLKKQL